MPTLNQIGDRINPIVVKEVRQAVNSRIVAGALLLFLAVQIIVMMFALSVKSVSSSEAQVDLRAGRAIFTIVQGILVGTCILIIPAFTWFRMAAERSDVNVDLMFITSLSPWKIISGKFVAATALALLIFSACAPFMTFAYVLRGLDVPTILLVLFVDFLAVLLGIIYAIFLAAVPASRGFRILLALIGVIALAYLTAGAIGVSVMVLEFDPEIDLFGVEFWILLAGTTTLVLGAIGLFFAWSIALVSPMSANRALPVRLFTLGLWLVTFAGCALICIYRQAPDAICFWGFISSFLFALQLLIAVSEREEWGPRVARRIPRSGLARLVAFLFFSGAAGGIAFALIGGGISIVVVDIFEKIYPDPTHSHLGSRYDPLLGALVVGYAYCFCLSAVLVRRLIKGRVLQPYHTWTIALILIGLGSFLPFLIEEITLDRYSRYARDNELHPMYLINPFVAIEDAMRETSRISTLTFYFVGAWSVIVTLLAGYWYARQIRLFHPPSRRAEKVLPAVAEAVP